MEIKIKYLYKSHRKQSVLKDVSHQSFRTMSFSSKRRV